ncbi:MAG: DsbC family protein [Gammaproteobacteria bacterium TMED112]|nr:MAG: DsbC family protein [Gammaproteobacteria bacterium TMED112]|tara:strand:+ start:3429 stop:4133 length:705 start_codon:yes stop_codon:yes gene_type:complete
MRFIKLALFLSLFVLSNEENLKDKIEKILPSGLPINFIEASSIPGFYVVNVANNQILYVSKSLEFVLAGEVIQLKEGQITSLNDVYQTKFIKDIVSTIDTNESINFISNNEKYKLTVFTDISCGYCRLLHSEIDSYLDEGLTINYLAFPRDGLTGNVYKNMVSAWCSQDQRQSLSDLKKGEEIKQIECPNPVSDHFRKGSLLGITGTPTIILEDGRMFSGYMPANELIKIIENG